MATAWFGMRRSDGTVGNITAFGCTVVSTTTRAKSFGFIASVRVGTDKLPPHTSFNELQRRTTSPEIAARYFDVVGDFDIIDLLAKVTTKTLVMHVHGDLVVPFEAGRVLAAGIPGARFVALQGQNHLFRENEQASQRFFEELKLFYATNWAVNAARRA
jgi:pimeloyl-ACP methyl ester carboxylesterase